MATELSLSVFVLLIVVVLNLTAGMGLSLAAWRTHVRNDLPITIAQIWWVATGPLLFSFLGRLWLTAGPPQYARFAWLGMVLCDTAMLGMLPTLARRFTGVGSAAYSARHILVSLVLGTLIWGVVVRGVDDRDGALAVASILGWVEAGCAALVALRLGIALRRGGERNPPLLLLVIGFAALALRPLALSAVLVLVREPTARLAPELLFAVIILGVAPAAVLGALASVHRRAIRARFAQMRAADLDLARSQREVRLSQLADGFAADFAEVIGGVRDVTAGLVRVNPSEEVVQRGTRLLRHAASRAEVLTRQLRDCAAPPTEEAMALDLAALVHRNLESLRAIGTEHEVQLGPMEPLRVVAPEAAVERILYNLVDNAVYASPVRGPAIELRLERVRADHAARASVPMLQGECDYAKLTVADGGRGIAAEDVALAFEPYATTKGTAGVGLGLPASRGLARRLGGDLSIESRVGVGTRVHLWLPIAGSRGETVA